MDEVGHTESDHYILIKKPRNKRMSCLTFKTSYCFLFGHFFITQRILQFL